MSIAPRNMPATVKFAAAPGFAVINISPQAERLPHCTHAVLVKFMILPEKREFLRRL